MLATYKEMQARELTPQEIADGNRGIQDRQYNATEVQAMVRKMDQSKHKWRHLRNKKTEYVAALKRENEVLYFNYPSLFDMHADDKLDATFFEMLQLKRKIERGEISAEDASRAVGQQLFNRYVPHAIDSNTASPAPRMRYEDFYKQNPQE